MTSLTDCYGLTVRGADRETNEDQFLIADLNKTFVTELSSIDLSDDLDEPIHGKLLIVADGLGSQQCGELASRTAVQSIAESVRAATPWLLDDASSSRETADEEMTYRLELACRQAHRAIRDCSRQMVGGREIGTALTAILLIDGQLYLAHAGHGRCYQLHEGKLDQLTDDHTEAAALEQLGVVDRDGVSRAGENRLWSCLGATKKPAVDANTCDHEDGDTLLLCTDGLYRNVSEAQIASILRKKTSAEVACYELLDAAKTAGATDDVTVVVMRPTQAARSATATAEAGATFEDVLRRSDGSPEREFVVQNQTAAIGV